MRQKRPDKKKALSIAEASEREMKFTLTLKPTEASGSTIVRNIYECFRMLGDALLVARGIEAHDHKIQIMELLKVDVDTARPIQIIDNLRQLRHNINYYGYNPKISEVEDVISIAKSCFEPLKKAVLEKIENI
ncbi:MAG: hypothetical protein KAR51_03670 [Candidatus Aenigmarchaeota archaeon]|nr:hypothetical protein [Candidatus Aenigmarchaeota archaeon]